MRVGTREVSHQHPVPEDHIPVSLRRRCGGECVRPEDVARSINRNGRAIRDVFCRGSGDQPLSGRRTRDLCAFDQYAGSPPTPSWCAPATLAFRPSFRRCCLQQMAVSSSTSDVSHEEGAAGTSGSQPATAPGKRRDYEIDGAYPRGHRAIARRLTSGGSRCPLHGR